jgi:ribonucleoside-diphosphate reductase alpha chain
VEKKVYSYDEAYEESLRYFQGDELAARVWVNKYAVKDSFGNIYEKSPEDMHWRIANEVARIEAKYPNALTSEELFGLLDHFKYIVPQGSPMTGIGNNYQVASLSNCFVIGVDGEADSYGAIFKIDEEQVQLMKRRGGVGHDLSHIRPKGSPVKNSALTSTGLVPFMERYSNSTREVAQDGRRGALMLSVSIKHPDSEAFIDAKMTEGKVTGANVSVKLTDAFMQAAIDGKPFVQQYPIDADEPLFKIQILTSSRPLAKNDKRLKGLKNVDYYKEGGLYKYTYGASSDYNKVLRTKRSITAKFKDAFIIAFKNGRKVNVNAAIREFKNKRNK